MSDTGESTPRPCALCEAIRAPGAALPSIDDRYVVLRPLARKAPVHFLIVPRRHADSVHELLDSVAGDALLRTAIAAADAAGVGASGFRLVLNSGPATDQTIVHPHLHLLGGDALPPSP